MKNKLNLVNQILFMYLKIPLVYEPTMHISKMYVLTYNVLYNEFVCCSLFSDILSLEQKIYIVELGKRSSVLQSACITSCFICGGVKVIFCVHVYIVLLNIQHLLLSIHLSSVGAIEFQMIFGYKSEEECTITTTSRARSVYCFIFIRNICLLLDSHDTK